MGCCTASHGVAWRRMALHGVARRCMALHGVTRWWWLQCHGINAPFYLFYLKELDSTNKKIEWLGITGTGKITGIGFQSFNSRDGFLNNEPKINGSVQNASRELKLENPIPVIFPVPVIHNHSFLCSVLCDVF